MDRKCTRVTSPTVTSLTFQFATYPSSVTNMPRPATKRTLNFDEEPTTDSTSPTQSNVVLFHMMNHYRQECEAHDMRFKKQKLENNKLNNEILRMQQSHIQLYDENLMLRAALGTARQSTDDYWSIIVNMRTHGIDTRPWNNAINRAAIRAEIAQTMGTPQQPIDLTGEETEEEEGLV